MLRLSEAIQTIPVDPSPILTNDSSASLGSPGDTTICRAARNCSWDRLGPPPLPWGCGSVCCRAGEGGAAGSVWPPVVESGGDGVADTVRLRFPPAPESGVSGIVAGGGGGAMGEGCSIGGGAGLGKDEGCCCSWLCCCCWGGGMGCFTNGCCCCMWGGTGCCG